MDQDKIFIDQTFILQKLKELLLQFSSFYLKDIMVKYLTLSFILSQFNTEFL
jgi:hypothetical protein